MLNEKIVMLCFMRFMFMLSVTTSRCWNHLSIKLRTSQSVNILKNASYKNFKLSQLRDKIFTPFLDCLFLDRMI